MLDVVQTDQHKTGIQAGPSLQRLQRFLEHSPGKPDAMNGLSVNPEKTVAMHRRTIDMRRKKPLPAEYRKFFLLELSNNENRGINADEQRGLVAEQLLNSLGSIQQHRTIFDCDLSIVEHIIQEVNQSKLTLILITANAFRRDRFSSFLQGLSRAESTVHISMLDDRDLTGNLDNEWTPWGFNNWTATALAQELLTL
jgi:hypothetical protein